MSSAQPFLLVDVDGVLNAFGFPGGHEDGLGAITFEAEFESRGFPIRVPAGTRERIATLETLFDCVWATSWEHYAITHLAPELGFGADWPVLRVWEDVPEEGSLKLPAVRRFADLPEQRSRALAWIDDDLEPDALAWAVGRTAEGVTTLIVQPDEAVGLTAGHVDRLVAFSEECA